MANATVENNENKNVCKSIDTIFGTFTYCAYCMYFEDCEEKESRDGCMFGYPDEENP